MNGTWSPGPARRLLAAAFAAVLGVLASAAPATAAEGESDEWTAVYLAGAKAGWMHTKVERKEESGKPVWSTSSEMSFSLARLGTALTVTTSSTVVEDEAGQVLRFTTSTAQGGPPALTEGTVRDGRVHLLKGEIASDFPYPAGALGTAAISRRLLAKGIRPGTSFTATAFSADAPDKVMTVTTTIGAEEKLDVLGRVLFLFRADVKNSLVPVPTTLWLEESGVTWVTSMKLAGLGEMRMYRTDERIARADIEPAEMFTQSLVEPDRPILEPRKLTRSLLRLSKTEGKLENVYEGEGQKVVGRQDGSIDLAIECWSPAPDFVAAARPWAAAGAEDFLRPTACLEIRDETVAKLAAEAVGDEKDAVECARRIEAFVRKRISKKNFNIGFATAAETARSLEGDCTEHAVLCAAIARAAGLPSRVAVGVVYLSPEEAGKAGPKNGFFGYHMWTEVLVAEGRWFPIDAAMGGHDATHVALVKSDLGSVNPQLDFSLVTLETIGTLRIEVIEPK